MNLCEWVWEYNNHKWEIIYAYINGMRLTRAKVARQMEPWRVYWAVKPEASTVRLRLDDGDRRHRGYAEVLRPLGFFQTPNRDCCSKDVWHPKPKSTPTLSKWHWSICTGLQAGVCPNAARGSDGVSCCSHFVVIWLKMFLFLSQSNVLNHWILS